GRLDGGGAVNGIVTVNSGAHLAGNLSLPAVLSTGDLNLNNAAIFDDQLNGATAGGVNGYDQINVTRAVSLTTPTLNATLGYVPAVDDKLFIIANDGTDPVSGTFAGLPQGARLALVSSVDSQTYYFTISYTGDSSTNSATGGNDVVLTCNQTDKFTGSGPDLGSKWQVPPLPKKFLLTYL